MVVPNVRTSCVMATPVTQASTRHDGLLVHIQPRAPRMQDFHADLLREVGVGGEPASSKSRRRALRACAGGDSTGCSRGSGSN